jgi:Fic family protein
VYFYWIRRIQPFSVANGLFARLVIHIYEYQQGYRSMPFTPLTRTAAPEWAVPPPLEAEGGRFDATTFVIKRLRLFLNAYTVGKLEMQTAVQRYEMLTTRFTSLGINHRQARILDEALGVPTTVFTIRRHARSRGLAYETARQDFLGLVKLGYLEQQRRGRLFEFRLSRDAHKRLPR